MKKLVKLSVLAALAAIVSLSCSNQSGKSSRKVVTGTIKIDGSSTVYPITEAVAEEFRVDNPEVKVTIGISGTGGGFKKFGRGETDISDASRPIKQEEIELCTENNIQYVELEVAYDGLAVIVHPENDWVDYFTVEELKKLWEPDKLRK